MRRTRIACRAWPGIPSALAIMHDMAASAYGIPITGIHVIEVSPPPHPKKGIAGGRRTWAIRPTERAHSTPTGKKDYDRQEGRRRLRNGGENV
jgi:hypothetical protein